MSTVLCPPGRSTELSSSNSTAGSVSRSAMSSTPSPMIGTTR